MAFQPVGFARFSPWTARAVLAAVAAAIVFCVGVSLSPLKSGFADGPSRGPGDVQLYRAEVDRIYAGESYYAVAADELRTRGYPTRSVFNWRAPLPMWLIGALPDVVLGKAALGCLALLTLVVSFGAVARQGSVLQACLAGVALSGALMFCVLGDIFVMPDVWAGVLIALSLAAFGLERPLVGVACGTAAMFCRELAAPYAVLSLLLALRGRRWQEVAAWSAGLVAFAAFYAWHVAQVLPLVRPDDVAHEHGWVRFGGAAFVISAIQMNAYLLVSPQWVTAILLPLVLVGFAGWQMPLGQRACLTMAMYVAIFAVVGQPFNQYWGSLIAPLACLGAARAPESLAELWRAAVRPRVLGFKFEVSS